MSKAQTTWQPVTILVPSEVRIPTVGDCPKCGRHVVSIRRWKTISVEVRKQIRKTFACAGARLLCNRCYMSAWTKGDHIDHPRSGIDDQTFVDEYKHLKESGVTEHEVREVLRMSVPAFDKALERAKTRGDL